MINVVRKILRAIYRTIRPHRRVGGFDALIPMLKGKKAIEIGGPSEIFARNNIMPAYPYLRELDICNFSSRTIWEGKIREGDKVLIDMLTRKYAKRLIREATDLKGIPSRSYDVVLASHVIEHIANPLKAVSEWLRVLKDGGLLIVVAPDKRGMFDRNRDITPFEHILQDRDNDVGEDDLTHLNEVLAKHDIDLDPRAGDMATFSERCRDNINNRCIHHHVFNEATLKKVVETSGAEVIVSGIVVPKHIYVFARKTTKR